MLITADTGTRRPGRRRARPEGRLGSGRPRTLAAPAGRRRRSGGWSAAGRRHRRPVDQGPVAGVRGRRCAARPSSRAADGRMTLVLPGERRDYRGTLQSVAARQGRQRETVNRVGMEAYLRGVVPQRGAGAVGARGGQRAVGRGAHLRRVRALPPGSRATTTSATPRSARSTAAPTSSTRRPTAAIKATAGQGLYYEGAPGVHPVLRQQRRLLLGRLDALPRGAGRPLRRPGQPDVLDLEPRRSTTRRSRSTGPAIGDLTGIEVDRTRRQRRLGRSRHRRWPSSSPAAGASLSGDDARSFFGLYSDWFTFSVLPRQKGPARP